MFYPDNEKIKFTILQQLNQSIPYTDHDKRTTPGVLQKL